jgi:dienelactone hydrolase
VTPSKRGTTISARPAGGGPHTTARRGGRITPLSSFIIETAAEFAAVIVVLDAAAAFALAVYLCRPRKKTYLDDYVFTPFETGVRFEPVSFVTADDIELAGWWLAGTGHRVVVGLTGRSGIKSDLLGVGSALARAGFHVLLFDFRGRGDSRRVPLGMGRREAADARAAVDYAAARVPDARIGMIGFSMGASTAILASSDDPRVEALALDSPFEDSDRLIVARMRGLFPVTRAVLLPTLTRLWARLLFHSDIDAPDVRTRAARTGAKRALVVVSGGDSVIPPRQQRSVYDALPCPKELWDEPDVDHCGTYFKDRAAYIERIIRFFSSALTVS